MSCLRSSSPITSSIFCLSQLLLVDGSNPVASAGAHHTRDAGRDRLRDLYGLDLFLVRALFFRYRLHVKATS